MICEYGGNLCFNDAERFFVVIKNYSIEKSNYLRALCLKHGTNEDGSPLVIELKVLKYIQITKEQYLKYQILE